MNENAEKYKHTTYRWLILALVWLVFFIESYAQYQISSVGYKIIPDLHLTSAQFASICMAPMLPCIFLSLVTGVLADRFGIKKIITIGVILSTIGMYCRFLATNYWEMYGLLFLTGIGGALLNAIVAKTLGAWFPKKQMGTAMGIMCTGSSAGMGVAQATTALFPTTKSAYILCGIVSLASVILWIAFYKDKPKDAPEEQPVKMNNYLGVVIKSKNVWLVGLIVAISWGGVYSFQNFLPSALHEGRGIDAVTAGVLASVVSFSGVIGSFAGPVLCDHLRSWKPFFIIMTVLGGATIYLSWVAPKGPILWLLLAANGILTCAIPPVLQAYPVLLPEIGQKYAGSAGGLYSTVTLLGCVFIPQFVGSVAGLNYNLIFVISTLLVLATVALIILLPEIKSKPKSTEENSTVA